MKNIKKTCIAFGMAFLAISTSCSKPDSGSNATSSDYSATLFTQSTGWNRVAIITPTLYPLGVANWLTPYDLNIVGSKVQVIFYQDSNFQQPNVSKSSYDIGGNSTASIIALTNLHYVGNGSAGVTYGSVFFKPNSYIVETLNSTGTNYLGLFNEVGTEITSHYVNNFYSGDTKMYANGDLLTGGLYSNVAPIYYYYTRATNSWTVNGGTSSSDQTFNIDYMPFKTADGSLLGFRFFNKNTPEKAFLSIADLNPSISYQDKFVEEHPEYAPTQYIIHQYTANETIFASNVSIANYAVEDNSFTVVLREENNTTHNYTLSAFKWTKGALAFQNLYSHLPISKILGDSLGANSVCQSNGEIGVLVREGTNGNEMTYSLATCNASGEHRYGAVVNNTYPRAVTLLSCLRFINGSYYAVASPSLFDIDNYEGQHLDVVKLTL